MTPSTARPPLATVEMLTVLDGALGVTVGDREHLIGTGDTILFDAVVARRSPTG